MTPTCFLDLTQYIAGETIKQADNLPITELLIDHYSPCCTPHPLFFNLTHHPKHYANIEKAYAQGVRQFVLDRHAVEAIGHSLKHSNILQVDHTLQALHQWLAFHRAQYQGPLLAIVGSYGKTTIKEWLSRSLSQHYSLFSTSHQQNTIHQMARALGFLHPMHQYAMVEIALEMPCTIPPLTQWLQPTEGLLTPIAPSSMQPHAQFIQRIEATAQLLSSCRQIFYCKSQKFLHQIIQAHYGQTKSCITWDIQSPADYIIHYTLLSKKKTKIQISHAQQTYTFVLPFSKRHALENSIHCIVYLLAHGWAPKTLQVLLQQWPGMPLHLVSKSGPNNCQILENPYNPDLLRLNDALAIMQKANLPKTVVLMDLAPTYQNPLYYQQLHTLLTQYHVQRLIGIGFTFQTNLFTMETHCFATIQAFKANLPAFQGDYILITSATPLVLDAIWQATKTTPFPNTLTINLAALLDNLAYFKRQLHTKTKILAMIKADAYGHGSVPIAWTLQPHVDYFGVTFLQEAIQLRKHGIQRPIMVMAIQPDAWSYCLTYELEPVLYSLELLEACAAFVKANHIAALPIHLKLDTGMHRLGFGPNLLPTLQTILQAHPALQVLSLFSHLSSAALTQYHAETCAQGALFEQMVKAIERYLPKDPLKHLLNSNGIVNFPQYQWDMVRLGIGLYGLGVAETPNLKPTDTFTTHISQVKLLEPGACIGYNRQATITKPTQIAILPIGYADGFRRAFGLGKGKVLIQDQLCPTIGEICMDMTMVDVSGLKVQPGDLVIIFNPEHNLEHLAQTANMTAYEYITQIGPRITKCYQW